MSVEICKAQELLEFFDLGGFRPKHDGLKFLGVYFDAISTNDKTKVFNRSFIKLMLCCIGTKFCVFEVLKDHGNMLIMFLLVPSED